MKKVLLIYGGTSTEHDVSCISAKSIINNIDKTKYILDCVHITKNNKMQKTFDSIIGQGWLHFDSVEGALNHED